MASQVGALLSQAQIELVNPDQPSQVVPVVGTEVNQPFFDPVWSPDGKTLLVVNADTNQPYAIDIAQYLSSKGLPV